MHEHSLPFNPQPVIVGTVVNAGELFVEVVRMGGSASVGAKQRWRIVAASLRFPVKKWTTAAWHLKGYWEANLLAYEQHSQIQQQQQQHKSASGPIAQLEAYQTSDDVLEMLSDYQVPKVELSSSSKIVGDKVPSSPIATAEIAQRMPLPRALVAALSSPLSMESDSDDPSISIPPQTQCRRKGCGALSHADSNSSREGETCV